MRRPLDQYKIPAGGQFGAGRAGGRTHQGCDYHPLDNNDGEPIWGAMDGGRVVHIGYNGDPLLGLGHNVTVDYPGGFEITVGHMMARTPLALGTTVNRNTLLGYVGHTGNAVNASPPGSHVHLMMRLNGVIVDPEKHFGPALAGTGTPIGSDTDMKIVRHPNGTLTAVGEVTYQHYKTMGEYDADALLYGPYKQVSEVAYNRVVASTQARRAYLLAAVTGTGGATVDEAAIATKVKASLAADFVKLNANIDAINAVIGAPTPEEIADAVWADAVDRLKV